MNELLSEANIALGRLDTMGYLLFKSYEAWGLEKPQIIEGANFVKCILPRGSSKLSEEKVQKGILALFYSQNEITAQDVVNKFSISRATAQRWLNVLIEKRLIERIGRTRNLRYRRIAMDRNGRGRIRTHGPLQDFCFQDRRNRPLCHSSLRPSEKILLEMKLRSNS